jgi:hypothetical protein
VYAALREFCHFEVRQTRRLAFNPVYAVELEPEITPEAHRWSAPEARQFLAACAGDPLHLLFRIVLLRGAARRSGRAGRAPTSTPATCVSSGRCCWSEPM